MDLVTYGSIIELRKWVIRLRLKIKQLLFYQLVALLVAAAIVFLSRSPWLITLRWSFVLTNSISLSILALDFVSDKFFKPLLRSAYSKFTYWMVIILLGATMGVLIGFFFICWIESYNYLAFLKNNFIGFVQLALFVSAVVTAVEVTVLSLKDKVEQKTRENEELKNLQARTRFEVLQSKINPHFLFNTLNAILSLSVKDPEKVETIILNLSDIYQRIFSIKENQMISLSEELDLVEKYLQIEKIRMGDRLSFSIAWHNDLGQVQIPPLLIEPIVENAVLHGISPMVSGGKIEINIRSKFGCVVVEIKDNGVGLKGASCQGFGIYSVRERLRLLHDKAFDFKLEPNPGGGTIARLELPK